MPTRTEEVRRLKKLKDRAVTLQARYGGVIKQIKLAVDNVGDRDLSKYVEEGRISITAIEPGMVLPGIPSGAVLVCCGGVSRRRRGAPFAFLVERTEGVTFPMGPQDATSALLPEALREDPGTAVSAAKVQQDRDSGLPDQVRPKRNPK